MLLTSTEFNSFFFRIYYNFLVYYYFSVNQKTDFVTFSNKSYQVVLELLHIGFKITWSITFVTPNLVAY